MFGGGINLEDLLGGHPGMGGGHPGMHRREQKPVDNKRFYELLGVERDATPAQIKKSYHKKALKMHPDKGGDPDAFKEITAAYEVLMDKDKREIYETHGEEGLKEGMGRGGGGGADIFEQMFGGGGMGGRPRGPQKGKSVQHAIKVTLEEIFAGKTSKIAVNRDRICSECEGRGGKDGADATCSGCKGRGMRTRMTQLGPGMYSQSTGPCDECMGSGTCIAEKDKCKECNGKKVLKERKVLEANVDKGSPHGEKYVFHGESDEYPDREAGDVIIVVNEQPHEIFKRKGADLLMEKEITLLESLTGCDFVVKHLDGTNLRVQSKPGQVIKPDTLMTIVEKGLPFHKSSYEFGNLFVLFKVKFPDSLNGAQVEQVASTFKGSADKNKANNDMVDETVMLKPFNEGQKNVHATGTHGDDEDEEEEGGNGQRVQCQQ